MRAGVRKAGPLQKNSSHRHPPYRAQRAGPKPRGRHHAPPYLFLLLLYYYNYYIKYKAQRAQNTKLVR